MPFRPRSRRLLPAALLLPVLLAACAVSPLEGKRADQAAVYTLYHHTADARYNFSGESRLTSLHVPGKRGEEEAALLQEVAGSFHMQYDGAVDMAQHRVELIPTLRFARPNAEAWVRFPLLLQLDTLTLYLDASAADLWLPALSHKLVKFQLPEDKLREIPVAAVLADLPDIVQRVYSAVEKKAYSYQPLSSADEKLGARYRIRLALDPVAGRVLSRQMVAELVNSLRSHGASQQVLTVAQRVLQGAESGQFQQQSRTDLLVSSAGRLLAVEEQRSMALPGDDPLRFAFTTRLNISNDGKPVFTLHPVAANVVDYREVKLPAWMTPPTPPAAAASAPGGVAPPQPAQPVPPAIKPKPGKPKKLLAPVMY
ncbi:hypothetical protein [Vogesella sp. LIG4]|uniref:hypothetical protein n=1 Tax=Vogesella sp. LIG4 TaxID=1192162 RepID=UPI00081FFEB4|nr:hypothetical protein [Vogesella sp. LIG4]SCK23402.1 hypothetical protein PSELUDRAFT_2725 [Vogesella sp. LIG4]